jgi:hypothetical protein
MSRCEDIVYKKEGKLLTNQTTVIVDITIRKTTLVRAAEHSVCSCYFQGEILQIPRVTPLHSAGRGRGCSDWFLSHAEVFGSTPSVCPSYFQGGTLRPQIIW